MHGASSDNMATPPVLQSQAFTAKLVQYRLSHLITHVAAAHMYICQFVFVQLPLRCDAQSACSGCMDGAVSPVSCDSARGWMHGASYEHTLYARRETIARRYRLCDVLHCQVGKWHSMELAACKARSNYSISGGYQWTTLLMATPAHRARPTMEFGCALEHRPSALLVGRWLLKGTCAPPAFSGPRHECGVQAGLLTARYTLPARLHMCSQRGYLMLVIWTAHCHPMFTNRLTIRCVTRKAAHIGGKWECHHAGSCCKCM